MSSVRPTYRGVAVAASTALLLGGSPLAGAALAEGLALQSTSPADGAFSRTVSKVSATYDAALAGTSTLSLSNGTTPMACESAVADQTVSCTTLVPLPDGAYTATTNVQAAGGSASDVFRFTVDTQAPAAPSVGFTPATITPSSQSAVTVSGKAEPFGSLVVTITDAAGASVQRSLARVPADGAYSFAGLDLSALKDGRLAASAVVTDRAGNASSAGTAEAVKDTAGPQLQDSSPDGSAKPGTDATPTPVTAAFDEALDTSSTITVAKAGNTNPRAGLTTFSADAKTITFTPSPTKLADGDYVASVTAQDRAGNVSTSSFPFTIDSVAPSTPSVTLPTYVNSVSVGKVAISGVADPLNDVTVTVNDDDALSAAVTRTVRTDSAGAYAFEQSLATLADGTVRANAVAADSAGNTSPASEPVSASKDTVVPAVATVNLSRTELGALEQRSVVVSGEVKQSGATVAAGEPGLSMVLTVSDTQEPAGAVGATATSGTGGGYSFPAVDLTSLGQGTLTATVVAVDAAGNRSAGRSGTAQKDTVAPAAPVVEVPAYANDADQTAFPVTGTAETGARLAVVVVDGVGGSAAPATAPTAGRDGAYTSAVDVSGLREGAVLGVTATATDSFGNTSAAGRPAASPTKDTVAPAPPATLTAPSYVNADSAGKLPVSGTVAAADVDAATVSLRIDDADGTTTPVTSAAPVVDGAFSASPSVLGLRDGTLTVTATLKDVAGNTGSAGTTRTTKDVGVPGAPALTSATTSVVQAGEGVTVHGRLDPADVGGAADLSALVTLDDMHAATTRVTGTTTAFEAVTGAFSVAFTAAQVETLADGALSATATVRDKAGNTGGAATPRSITKNTTQLAYVFSAPAKDATVMSPARIDVVFTEPLQQDVDGKPKSTITLSDADGPLRCARSFPDARTISCVPPPALSEAGNPYTVTVNAFDNVGQTVQETIVFRVDGTPPPAPAVVSVTGPVSAASADDVSVVVSGAGLLPTDTVDVRIAGSDGAAVTVPASRSEDGSYRASGIDVTTLPDGVLAVTATATDRVGNRSASGARASTTKDTVEPRQVGAAPTGTTQPPSVITLSFGEELATATATVTAQGSTEPVTGSLSVVGGDVVFTPAAALVDGGYAVTAAVADAAGNPATGSSSFTVDGSAPEVSNLTATATSIRTTSTTVRGEAEDGASVTLVATDGAGTSTAPVLVTVTGSRFEQALELSSLVDGEITVTAVAEDAVGNVGPQASTATSKDSAAPTLSTTGPGSVTRSSAASLGFTGSDPGRVDAVLTYQCRLDTAAFATCTSPTSYSALADGLHTFEVVAADEVGNSSLTTRRTWRVDTVVPTVAAGSAPVFSTASAVGLRYSGADSGSGIKSYDVRHRSAPYDGGFGSYVYPNDPTRDWIGTTATSVTLPATPGRTYCLSVRSRDKAGNVSGWSPERCTGVALDDRALTASNGWSLGTSTPYYRGTVSTTKTLGATLTRTGVQAKRLAVVASRCPGCGTVEVYWNGKRIRTISLDATTTSHKQVIPVATFTTAQSGTLVLKAVKSAVTRIDGVGVNRT